MYEIDEATIAEEARYDGFYAVCTNLNLDDFKETTGLKLTSSHAS